MKVNFKDLFINTIVLLCIVLLSALIYVPIGIIEDLVRSFIVVFVNFIGIPALLFDWFFSILEYGGCILGFMFLFNKRFEDLESFKEQVNGNDTKKVLLKEDNNLKDDVEEIELPKTKSS